MRLYYGYCDARAIYKKRVKELGFGIFAIMLVFEPLTNFFATALIFAAGTDAIVGTQYTSLFLESETLRSVTVISVRRMIVADSLFLVFKVADMRLLLLQV